MRTPVSTDGLAPSTARRPRPRRYGAAALASPPPLMDDMQIVALTGSLDRIADGLHAIAEKLDALRRDATSRSGR